MVQNIIVNSEFSSPPIGQFNYMMRLLTFNIHKGFSALNRRLLIHQLRDAIRSVSADIVFLQEVTGRNSKKAKKHDEWPEDPHYEFLAESTWPDFVYGKNSMYPNGHHGNALLSKFPIIHSKKYDISTNRFEKRGFLYSVLDIPDSPFPLHCICVHLGLSVVSRKKQLKMLETFIDEEIQKEAPIVLAGDFNEWRKKNKGTCPISYGLKDAALETKGKIARTFPSILPILPLDRIYIRWLKAKSSKIYFKGVWSMLSDHSAFFTEVELDPPSGI